LAEAAFHNWRREIVRRDQQTSQSMAFHKATETDTDPCKSATRDATQ
jgi:hypothetical protein